MQLVTAVAAERFEYVTGEAGGVHADQGGFGRGKLSPNDGHRLLVLVIDRVGDHTSWSETGHDWHFDLALDQSFPHPPVTDQVFD